MNIHGVDLDHLDYSVIRITQVNVTKQGGVQTHIFIYFNSYSRAEEYRRIHFCRILSMVLTRGADLTGRIVTPSSPNVTLEMKRYLARSFRPLSMTSSDHKKSIQSH